MSMINKVRLEEFANGLWAKIKTQLGENIVNLTYDEVTRIVTATKKDNTTIELDLNKLATTWANLDHTRDMTFTNKLYGLTPVVGHYEASGNLNPHNNFRSYVVPCEPGKTYMRTNASTFQNTSCNLRGGSDGADFIQYTTWVECIDPINGRRCWSVTIPDNVPNVTHFTLSYNYSANQGVDLMVWERGAKPPQAYVENTAVSGVLIEEYVHMQFDPSGTGLSATTIDNAIRDLVSKVNKGGKVQTVNNKQPDAQGNIQILPSDLNAYGYNMTQIDDANTFTDTGYARTHNSTKNLPQQVGAPWGVIQCLKENTNQLMQFWYQFDGLYPGRVYKRIKVSGAGGNWTNWDVITTLSDLNSYLLKSDVANAANKVPRLNAQGKLETSILPTITINDTFAVDATDQADGETKAMSLAVENGDLVVMNVGAAPNVDTKKYICGDATKSTFAEKFIELSFPADGVTEGELQQILQRELAKYVLTSDTGTGANQVLRLDANAKIADTNLNIATADEINTILNALN